MNLPSLLRNQALPCAITLSLLAAGSASAADGTWTGGTSTSWTTTANWSGGTVAGSTDANSDTATFNSSGYLNPPTIANGWILGTLLFGSGNTGALTVNTGNNSERLNLSVGIQMDEGSGAVIIGAANNRGIALLNNVSFANNSSSLLTVRVLTVDELVLSGTNTVTINGSGSGGFTLSAPAVDGSGGAKLALNINTSSGATSLGADSTYSGGTTLSAGTLQVGVASVGSVGAITSSAIGTGTLALNGGTLSSGSGNARTLLNAVTVGGNVTLGNAVNDGKLTFSGTIDLGEATRTLTTESDVVFSNTVSNGGITKAGTGQLTFTGGSANTYSGTTTVNDGTLVLAKTVGVNAIAGGLTIGDGTNGDTVNLGASEQIADTAVVNMIGTTMGQRGNFQLLGFNETIGGLSGGGQVQNASSTADSVLTLNVANATTQTSSAVLRNTGGIATGSLSIVKTGGGTQILDGNMTYTGATTVSAGSLIVNGNQSAATGVLTVSSGATLGGSGTIGGATTISGIHSPGTSPGVQTFTSGLTYSNGSTFVWELTGNTSTSSDRGIAFDGVNVSGGTLTIDGGVTNNLVFNGVGSTVNWSDAFWASNQEWLVFSNASSPTVSSNVFETIIVGVDSLTNSLTSVRSGSSFSWDTIGDDVYLTYAIPEPSTYALLALLGAGFAGRALVRRRRRHGVD